MVLYWGFCNATKGVINALHLATCVDTYHTHQPLHPRLMRGPQGCQSTPLTTTKPTASRTLLGCGLLCASSASKPSKCVLRPYRFAMAGLSSALQCTTRSGLRRVMGRVRIAWSPHIATLKPGVTESLCGS